MCPTVTGGPDSAAGVWGEESTRLPNLPSPPSFALFPSFALLPPTLPLGCHGGARSRLGGECALTSYLHLRLHCFLTFMQPPADADPQPPLVVSKIGSAFSSLHLIRPPPSFSPLQEITTARNNDDYPFSALSPSPQLRSQAPPYHDTLHDSLIKRRTLMQGEGNSKRGA